MSSRTLRQMPAELGSACGKLPSRFGVQLIRLWSPMPWKPPSNFMILSRPRYARATRIANASASVPDDTNRICSAHATASTSSAASRMPYSLLAKKVKPRSSCSRTAATTSGCPCPTNIGPDPSKKSTYSRPSMSVTRPAWPSRMMMSPARLPKLPAGSTRLAVSITVCTGASIIRSPFGCGAELCPRVCDSRKSPDQSSYRRKRGPHANWVSACVGDGRRRFLRLLARPAQVTAPGTAAGSAHSPGRSGQAWCPSG